MSTQFVNGSKYSILKIYNTATTGRITLVDTISLPLVNEEGMVESTETVKISHSLFNSTLEEKILGYRLRWDLPYSNYTNKNLMLQIQQLYRYFKAGYKVVLIPRADLLQRSFEILASGDSLEYGIKKGGSKAVGNRLLKVSFVTKDLISDLGWMDIDNLPKACWYQHNYFTVKV